jgi:hypothetical protein
MGIHHVLKESSLSSNLWGPKVRLRALGKAFVSASLFAHLFLVNFVYQIYDFWNAWV